MQDVKMTDHQNCRAWNCRTWKWRTKNDARARVWNEMLNLYSVYSASNVRRLCALLCPAISFLHLHVLHFQSVIFMSCNFMSCIFMSCIFSLSFSCPAISCPAHWSFNFMSCNFMLCKLVCQFHVRHFHVQHFQRPQQKSITNFWKSSRVRSEDSQYFSGHPYMRIARSSLR